MEFYVIVAQLNKPGREAGRCGSQGSAGQPLGLTVLFGQRKGSYRGEFGLEALASMTEYGVDANPDYLLEQKEEALASDDFGVIGFVELEVDEAAVRAILYPEAKSLPARVVDVSF